MPSFRPLPHVFGAWQEDVAYENNREHNQQETNAYHQHRPPHVEDPVTRSCDHIFQEEVCESAQGTFAVDGLAIVEEITKAGEVGTGESDSYVIAFAIGKLGAEIGSSNVKGGRADAIENAANVAFLALL